jgi:hypothetical protein
MRQYSPAEILYGFPYHDSTIKIVVVDKWFLFIIYALFKAFFFWYSRKKVLTLISSYHHTIPTEIIIIHLLEHSHIRILKIPSAALSLNEFSYQTEEIRKRKSAAWEIILDKKKRKNSPLNRPASTTKSTWGCNNIMISDFFFLFALFLLCYQKKIQFKEKLVSWW